ncbi:MAG: DUF6873 family GME fold protein [Clostridium sp.]
MKLALVDYRLTNTELNALKNLNCIVIKVPPCTKLYDAVMGHPDMLLNVISPNCILVHPDMNINFLLYLKNNFNISYIYSKNTLTSKYPFDIFLNAVNLNNYFIHTLKYTDENLLKYVTNKHLLNVKQGYTKCSTAIISEKAVITSDNSIYNELTKEDFDVLLVPPGDIELPGLNYGFIGGCCGLLDENHLVFYGSLNKYKYKNEVLDFLSKHNITPIYLSNTKLIDRGSIFFIDIP